MDSSAPTLTLISQPFAVVQTVSNVNPKVTEELLLTLEGVLDASVWFDSGALKAHVTLHNDTIWTERALQSVCLDELGLHQTPRTILLIASRPDSAIDDLVA